MLRSQRTGHVHVKRRVVTLRQIRSVDCPTDSICQQFTNSPCRRAIQQGCFCEGIVVGVCRIVGSSLFTNANLHFKKNGEIHFTPSEYLQYTIVNTPKRGKFIVRTFRFKMKNKNRKSFISQTVNSKGKLESKRITFKQANRCNSCSKKRG
ncbi:hypothetical protein [Longirhabdus pacifica]|uniref:hypothetical protein n=1 Tax=Longirhabdus pacifica TaxID=2305227 RepID=UPI001008FA61|nr:hypothetical protein [Longirhabdus pacifica]